MVGPAHVADGSTHPGNQLVIVQEKLIGILLGKDHIMMNGGDT